MEFPSSNPEKSESTSVFAQVIEFSRSGFALWVWAELIRCKDTEVLCFLGAALTLLQADPCHVTYRLLKKFRWSFEFSLALWLVLVAITWLVVYKKSQP